jgi:hypothetical protein
MSQTYKHMHLHLIFPFFKIFFEHVFGQLLMMQDRHKNIRFPTLWYASLVCPCPVFHDDTIFSVLLPNHNDDSKAYQFPDHFILIAITLVFLLRKILICSLYSIFPRYILSLSPKEDIPGMKTSLSIL